MTKFDFAVSAVISEETVKRMICAVVDEQTGRVVERVEFKLKRHYEDRPNGGSTMHFDGAEIFFKDAK
jgi:hypothetical protein